MSMSKFLLLLMLTYPWLMAEEPIDKAIEKGKACLSTGSYEMARELLETAAGSEQGQDAIEPLIELYWVTGTYEQAIALAKKLAQGKENLRGSLLLGEILLQTGRYEEAKEALLEAYQAAPNNLEVQSLLGMYYLVRGQKEKYLQFFGAIFDRYDPANEYSPRELVAVARACRYYAMKSDETDRSDTLKTLVNKILPRAISQEKYCFAAYQEHAEIFLEAFDTIAAKTTLQAALELNPHHPALLTLQTSCQLQQFYSRPNAIPTLHHALRINPNFMDAIVLEAIVYLSDQEYDKAERLLQKAATLQPNHLTVRSLLAAIYYMHGRTTAYEAECNKVLAINPNYGELYYIIGNMVIHKRLFSDSVSFYRKAIELDPFLWNAYIELGTNLMRLGEEKEAERHLRKVEEEYNFHTQTHNTLLLLKKYAEFKLFETKHFKIRLHISEAETMLPLVSKLLEEAYQTLAEKFQFTPEAPILFEMFPDHKDFSVRTIGLEALGASGVCFGKVVAIVSPQTRPRDHNWASVAWHEFTHVVTLQMTNFQIPRWFTEGLSEFAERQRNASCQRGLDLELYSAYCNGIMRGIASLNAGFTRPEYPQEIVVCYYQATLICEFLNETKGFDKILEMLQLYKQEKSDTEVFKTVLGISLEEFDRQFMQWLQTHVFSQMDVFPTVNPKDIEELKDAITENPKNADAYLKLSLGYLQHGRFTDAEIYASQLLSLSPNDPSTYDILGYLAYEQKNVKQAKIMLEKAANLGSKNFYTYLILGNIFLQQKNTKQAIEAFQKAKAGFPAFTRQGNPYQRLAEIYTATGQESKAIEETEAYLLREGNDFESRMKLAKIYFKQQAYPKCVKLLCDARDIYPLDQELYSMLAQSYRSLQEWHNAKATYKLLLNLIPQQNRYTVHTELAEVCLELKEYAEAQQCVEAALRLQPQYTPALELLKKIPH